MKLSRPLRTFIASACFFVCLPAFSDYDGNDTTGKDDSQVYHIYADVDLVTTLKYRYGINPKSFVKAVYPQLEGDVENDFINRFNGLVTDLLKQEIATFRQNAGQNQKFVTSETKIRNNLYIDYDSSVIKSGADHIISIRFTMQGYLTGMAHPFHYHRVLNYDIDSGQKIELDELFMRDSNYLEVIADYVKKVLDKRLDYRKMVAEGTTPTLDHFKLWNIKPNGLLFTFDEYQVAPYVYGAQTVLVPYSVLKDRLADNSPLSGCVTHKKKCSRSNILTGGFIDEAVNTRHRALNPVLGKL